jgi:hypothetical protein
MSPEALRQELRRQPFVPLRLHLTDGTTYDIRHPEMVLLKQRELYIGKETAPGSGVAAETDLVSLLHVVRVEPLRPAQPPVSAD